MKRFATILWGAGVLGGLLVGAQTLAAAPSVAPSRAECWECWDMGGGRLICEPVVCTS
jgi:hypothetical protein